MTQIDWPTVFDSSYTKQARRETRRQVWREVFGEDHAGQADPYSYVSETELARFAAELRVGPGELLLDLGCGRGGPGLVLAVRTGARLLGLDISEVALEEARRAAARIPAGDGPAGDGPEGEADGGGAADSGRAVFRRGEFADTGLPDGAAGAVMSVDAFTFALDKQQACEEIFRTLAPGGRFVFTSWDYHRTPEDRPPQVPDHRPLLEQAGFVVHAYEETRDWRERIEAISRGLIARRDELAEEEGPEAADAVVASLRQQLEHQIPLMSRRFLAIAERPS
ncbi:methyltransferase domain-containing protein [Streptomyces sp. N2-109]|uniref:Methyltransferase domain-containing protein n=1 Tax=Streptomyces gossypii TaxID=2883101 RepID=A0ABT2K553_9ACTN|nr:class I SAM-dependent methyltransferase [Streptomyces gossypii]MCT2594625.1 methyltransferase domain-containing protein [Streptomyces gossypii]